MSHTIVGYGADALQSLTSAQVHFLQILPKAELHAHLNGSIPYPVLQQLANEYQASAPGADNLPENIRLGLAKLQAGVVLDQIDDFFGLFPAIYAITCSPAPLRRATRAVLEHFLSEQHGPAQAAYLELRSTPRETPAMSRRQYLEAVLDEVEQYPPERAALIVSLDRRMDVRVTAEVIECAISLRKAGRRVVGVDLCGDPKVRTSPLSSGLCVRYGCLIVQSIGRRCARIRAAIPRREGSGVGRDSSHRRGIDLPIRLIPAGT